MKNIPCTKKPIICTYSCITKNFMYVICATNVCVGGCAFTIQLRTSHSLLPVASLLLFNLFIRFSTQLGYLMNKVFSQHPNNRQTPFLIFHAAVLPCSYTKILTHYHIIVELKWTKVRTRRARMRLHFWCAHSRIIFRKWVWSDHLHAFSSWIEMSVTDAHTNTCALHDWNMITHK